MGCLRSECQGMPPMWGYPPGGGGVYRRRGDRAPAYHSGWADGSDSDEERARDPSKVPGEAAFQAYIMIGMIVIVMAVVGSVKLYELWYGKPDIPENRIEF
ncbi:hypothetical protein HDE_00340 [Halotydeus destructor]|nr:hypothetical protein HDE_00340 [Halotydeus destructor]